MIFGIGMATCLGGMGTAVVAMVAHDARHDAPTNASNRLMVVVFGGMALAVIGFCIIAYAVNKVSPFFH